MKVLYSKIIMTAFIGLLPLLSQAAGIQKIDSTLAKWTDLLSGSAAHAIAGLAIIALGYAAMKGQIPWGWVISIVVGIVFIIGGSDIAHYGMGGY